LLRGFQYKKSLDKQGVIAYIYSMIKIKEIFVYQYALSASPTKRIVILALTISFPIITFIVSAAIEYFKRGR
jgi:hypothetical protein